MIHEQPRRSPEQVQREVLGVLARNSCDQSRNSLVRNGVQALLSLAGIAAPDSPAGMAYRIDHQSPTGEIQVREALGRLILRGVAEVKKQSPAQDPTYALTPGVARYLRNFKIIEELDSPEKRGYAVQKILEDIEDLIEVKPTEAIRRPETIDQLLIMVKDCRVDEIIECIQADLTSVRGSFYSNPYAEFKLDFRCSFGSMVWGPATDVTLEVFENGSHSGNDPRDNVAFRDLSYTPKAQKILNALMQQKPLQESSLPDSIVFALPETL